MNIDNPSLYTIENALENLKNKKVFIYGAGGFGKEIFMLLQQHNIEIVAFIDKNAKEHRELFGKKVYEVKDSRLQDFYKEAIILFSIVMDKTERQMVIEEIQNQGFINVIESQSIRCLLVGEEDLLEKESRSEYYLRRKEDILKADKLWEDELSKKIYKMNVSAHIHRDYRSLEYTETDMKQQYFPEDIKLNKGYSHVIDCGGYIGDTILELIDRLKENEILESIVSFEPNLRNFNRMTRACNGIQDKVKNITLIPCAVSDTVKICRFHIGTGSGTLGAHGEELVQSIGLDEILKNYKVTFMKMDIEGEELKAIKGAERLIKENRPDLAICVYHYVNHLWDIVLILNSWNLGYRFYLRSYNAYTMETVLYATCEN